MVKSFLLDDNRERFVLPAFLLLLLELVLLLPLLLLLLLLLNEGDEGDAGLAVVESLALGKKGMSGAAISRCNNLPPYNSTY